MWDKRYPSIFDIFESFAKGFPFDRKEKFEDDWFKEPFEEMIKRFEESVPEDFKEFRARGGYFHRHISQIWPIRLRLQLYSRAGKGANLPRVR